MAWRVQDHVVRGVLDNCTYGRVTGKIWICGRREPLTIDLQGNADCSFAGCRLEFRNRNEPRPMPEGSGLATLQRGYAVDMSCDRKIRLPLVPIEEYIASCEAGEEPPEMIANALHLEWESEVHGRILVESPNFDVRISLPVWQLIPEIEEWEEDSEAGAFFTFLGEFIPGEGPGRQTWDEFDYDRFLRARDASLDRLDELLDDLEEEVEWEEADGTEWASSEDAGDRVEAPGGAREDDLIPGTFWSEGVYRGGSISPGEGGGAALHPLAQRAADWSLLAVRDAAAVTPIDQPPSHLVADWRDLAVELGAQLAGVLNHECCGLHPPEPEVVIALLKRALATIDILVGRTLELGKQAIFPEATVGGHRDELFFIREEILELIQRLRHR